MNIENRFSPGPADRRNQATLRHPERSIYRCFLTDLAGFMNICRAGPNYADRQGRKKIGPSHSNTSFAERGYCTPFPGFCQARFWESFKGAHHLFARWEERNAVGTGFITSASGISPPRVYMPTVEQPGGGRDKSSPYGWF